MTKTEIISRIIDRITDPWTESPEDYQYAELIDLDTAKDVLKQYRDDDDDCDLEPDERMPKEATPALLMEAYNCNIRYQKFELRVERLAEYIKDNEMVCEYDNYYKEFSEKKLDVYPVDFIWDSFPFQPIGDMSPDNPLFLIELGQRSKDFSVNQKFSWYDREHNELHSTNTPFADGILDAEAFARFTLSDKETLDYFVNGNIMTEDDIIHVFGCTADELRKEMNI